MAKKDDTPKIEVQKYKRIKGQVSDTLEVRVTNDPSDNEVSLRSRKYSYSSIDFTIAEARKLLPLLETMINSVEEK